MGWGQVCTNPYLQGDQMNVVHIRRIKWMHPKPIKTIYGGGYDNAYTELLLILAEHNKLKINVK